MLFYKYGLLALTLIIGFVCSSSVDIEDVHGDREKRTLILGVLFKKLLLQQALARNMNTMQTNSTTIMAEQEMMGDSNSSQQPPSSQPPSSTPLPPQPQTSPPTQSTPEESLPVLSTPQGIPNPQAVPQRPLASQEFPRQQQVPVSTRGFPPINSFNPSQQAIVFPANFPFGVQKFNQLPFGPAPPLGAQAGPQSGARFTLNYPFNIQSGYFQMTPQQIPLQSPTDTSILSFSQPANQSGPQNAQSDNSSSSPRSTQEQIPPSSVGSPEQIPPSTMGQIPPSAMGSSDSGGPLAPTESTLRSQESTQIQSNTEPSGPIQLELQNFSETSTPGDESVQGLSPASSFAPPSGSPPTNNLELQASQLSAERADSQPNFSFGLVPSGPAPSQGTEGTQSPGSPPNFSFDTQQGTRFSNEQANLPPQPQQLDSGSQQQFNSQLQQQLSNNRLPGASNVQQNFASANGSPQPGPSDNSLFDLRQFAGADNSVFDFPQESGTPSSDSDQQQPTQPESFPNGLFGPTGRQQFNSANDPQSNLAFRGQFDLSPLFQDSGNFERNFFQQSLF